MGLTVSCIVIAGFVAWLAVYTIAKIDKRRWAVRPWFEREWHERFMSNEAAPNAAFENWYEEWCTTGIKPATWIEHAVVDQ